MHALHAFAGFCAFVLFLLNGQPSRAQPRAAVSIEPTPIQDDANLHDVQLMGAARVWAVGDHGVVWYSRDGGRNWTLQPTSVNASLRSVCFLTDRVGWIVGGRTIPYAQIGTGVVLFTENGGETWQRLAADKLPQLYHVQFFDLQHGIAVGETRPEQPTGVFVTQDGGETWNPISGKRQSGWRAADFIDVETGALAGQQGMTSVVGGGGLQPTRAGQLGLQGLRDIDLARDGRGWLVGEGALLRRTNNAGLVWQSPPVPLPEGLSDFFDFRAVASFGDHVWVAGSPGSAVWHSDDGGQSWNKQITGHTVPINRLRFTNERDGWAVGTMGSILATNDGGQRWQNVRGNNRRAALMSLSPRAGGVSLRLLAQQSAEHGYRSVVLLPARHDLGSGETEGHDLDARLHEAVISAGGSAAQIDWQFPIERPEHEKNLERLVADWNRHTEGRLRQVFLGKLVSRLRTWRPTAVVVDEPSPDDAVAKLIYEAALQAIGRAADPTFHLAQQELAALQPWQVQRVFVRLPPGSHGEVDVDPSQYLLRSGMTVATRAAVAEGILKGAPSLSPERETFRLVFSTDSEAGEPKRVNDFFKGLALAPDSAARRRLTDFDDAADEQRRRLARRQRNVQAYARQRFDEPQQAAQVLAHFRQLANGLPPDQAALQLAQLADAYRQRAQWDLVEATYVELVSQYADEPVALDAMRWLFQLWSGLEPAWQRVRTQRVTGARLVGASVQTAKFGQLAGELLGEDLGRSSAGSQQRQGTIRINGDESWRKGTVEHWHEQAIRMAQLMRAKSPALYRSPEVQFPLASLLRERGLHRMSDRLYDRFQRSGAGDAWNAAAAAELWINGPLSESPRATVVCRRAAERPTLDGLLSDACWQGAQELRLTSSAEPADNTAAYAFAMLAYDDEYLYFAWTIPKSPDAPNVSTSMSGRTHDADLTGHDRVTLFLDIDRDYETCYAIHVDQRGYVAEQCWNDASWNPQMFIHADANDQRWRIEAAIPFRELAPAAPAAGVVWGAGIVRTLPAVGWESWTHPAGSDATPQSFGLLRFR